MKSLLRNFENFTIFLCLVAAVSALLPVCAQGNATRVHFPRGRTSTVVTGRILGFDTKDYLVGARAGQTMKLHLSSSNPYAYFVVYSINGRATDMNETTDWSEQLSETGDYMIRVFIMRAGARRKGAAANYRLSISID